jgi:hypothetical protein
MTPRVIPGARHFLKDQALLFEADMAKTKSEKFLDRARVCSGHAVRGDKCEW